MESKFFVQADRELLTETLTLDGSPVDLTNRNVETIFSHDEDGQIDLENDTEIVDAASGQIRHQLTTQDLNRAGNYTMEWLLTGGPDDPTTLPKQYPVDVHVRGAARLVEHAIDIKGIDANRIEFEGKTIEPQQVNTTTLTAVDISTNDLETRRISSKGEVVELLNGIDMGGNEITGLSPPTDENSAARLVDVARIQTDINSHTGVADAHHSRYTDEEVEQVIEALTHLNIDVSGSASYADEAADAKTLDGFAPSYFLSQDDFDFHEAQSGIHHERYQNSEAVDAVNAEETLTVDIQGNASTATYAEYADVVGDEEGMYIRDLEFDEHTTNPSAHHSRYADFEALEAVNNEELLDVSVTGSASTADYADTAGSLEGVGAAEFAPADEFNTHRNDPAAHHSRYTNMEARSAINGSTISPAEIAQSSHPYLDLTARVQQDHTLNRRFNIAPNAGDTVSALGWLNNFLYRSYGEEREVIVSPEPASGSVGDMFRPSGQAEWSVNDLPVTVEFALPESEVFSFFANSPTSNRYMAEEATLELRIDGSWQEITTSTGGRPYILDDFYDSDATRARITFDGQGTTDQQFFRIDCIAGYNENTYVNGAYMTREGGRMFGDIDMNDFNLRNIGNIDEIGENESLITGEMVRTGDGSTRVFRMDTGGPIEHIRSVVPKTPDASTNFCVYDEGTDLVIEYNMEPANGVPLEWDYTIEGGL